MIESRAKSFVDELRKRYDMAFATFIVDNMRKQNMLKEDKIAELLKDNPNEKQGRCQKKAAIGAHDAASAEKGRGIIPGMVQGGGGVSKHAGAGATSFFARGAVVMEGVICVRI